MSTTERRRRTTSTAEPQSRVTSTAEQQGQAMSTAELQRRATSTAEHSHRATSTDERRLRGDDVRLTGVWNSPRGGRVGASIRCEFLGVKSWSALTSVLSSETSNLRELHLTAKTLDLTRNDIKESEVKCLSAVLENPHCKLETLRMCNCGVSVEGCAALTLALRSNPSHLRGLNLSYNLLGDSGVKSLSAVLENPHCKLETLKLCKSGISGEGCAALTSALRSNPSHLRDLDLSFNNVGESGVKCLSAVLENTHCKLEKLWLWDCGVSNEGCVALTKALRSNPSHLRDLNLSGNNLGDPGVKRLSAVLENPHCKLEKLGLGKKEDMNIRKDVQKDFPTSSPGTRFVISPNPNKELLSSSDSEELNVGDDERMRKCGVSNEGCAALTSALRSNPSHLRELDLSNNNVGDSVVKSLSAVLENLNCKLEKLVRYF
ncbi:hypothetical protein QTP70_012950 [Hemibagrus guttatus]|uniref:Uncharacterized protein n=1 Tax=Hemibagrus guttatus TaxID=175788 RepID=A0AAE0QBL6_9TELE|nr:hypothetical protein QTP70_012950 [Hemibagrus guttatus]